MEIVTDRRTTRRVLLAAVTVLEGAGHWDWDRITQQIVNEAGEAVRLQLALEGLDRLIGDRPDAD